MFGFTIAQTKILSIHSDEKYLPPTKFFVYVFLSFASQVVAFMKSHDCLMNHLQTNRMMNVAVVEDTKTNVSEQIRMRIQVIHFD